MPYANAAVPLKQRLGSIGVVVAVHAGLGALLVTGLAVSGVIDVKPRNPTTFPVPVPTVPPPPPTPEARNDDSDPLPPTNDPYIPPQPSNIPLPRPTLHSGPIDPGPIRLDLDDFQVTTPGSGTGITSGATATPTPTPTPTPIFTPRDPRPSNNPGGWATTRDYPSISIRREEEGIASFRVSVGTNGRVTACEITRSSGHPRLDRATCDNVTNRARFEPARNDRGEDVVGTYSNRITWQLPD